QSSWSRTVIPLMAIDRRSFLTSALGSMASATFAYSSKAVASKPPMPHPKPLIQGEAYDPTTLFLTWTRDPTTTINVQWVAPETTGDTAIYIRSLDDCDAGETNHATVAKPYPNTELKVYRAEIGGLTPGSEYQFQIGRSS